MRDFQSPGRSAVFATNGMVATSHPIGAQVGLDMLKRGGSAMDAAIAGAIVLGLCEPQMTGIGGDLFALVSPAGTNDIIAWNGSGRAPMGADADALRASGHRSVPTYSAHAVTIPGAVHAFEALSSRFGTLGLDTLLAPSIAYAQNGIPVAPRVAFDWQTAAEILTPTAQQHYLIDGKCPKPGDLFRAPAQAEALKRIAKDGARAFYEDEIAEDLCAALQAAGGSHTPEDFAQVQTEQTQPISGDYKDVRLIEHPPNGQGATALLMLNILKHFDISALDYDARNRFLADPDHTQRLAHMMSAQTAADLAALIDPARAMASPAALSEAVHKDTIYITAVDRDGMSVSLIYSIFHGFGSGIASEKFGILLQNRGAGFTLDRGHPNEYGPRKRPMHTIIPGMLDQAGGGLMPFGVMGGAYQPNGHARFVSNLQDVGMDLQTAIDAPRAFSDAGILKVERGYSDSDRTDHQCQDARPARQSSRQSGSALKHTPRSSFDRSRPADDKMADP